jgi:hypothetical protein
MVLRRKPKHHMDAKLIDTLAALDPKLARLPSAAAVGVPRALADKAKARFTAFYSNVAFGWYIATSFADAHKPFPICVPTGTNRWLFKAYMMRLNGDKWHCKHIVEAYAIAQLPEARALKGKLCGLLLSGCGQEPDAHRRAVAETSGIPLHTVEAFDCLFYNIIDRYKESAFVSEQVYPNTRYVEFAEDYMKNADISDLVKRAGYNGRDLSLSAFLSGMGDATYMSKLSARSDREQELTRHLMGNALLLVHSGALNNRNVGISRAQSLLAAQRQAGPTVDLPPVADAGDYMAAPLRAALNEHDVQREYIARLDAGG